jgi:hypothetical protein
MKSLVEFFHTPAFAASAAEEEMCRNKARRAQEHVERGIVTGERSVWYRVRDAMLSFKPNTVHLSAPRRYPVAGLQGEW